MSDRPSSSNRVVRQAGTRNRQRLGYRRIVQLLVYLVIVPTVLMLSLGIILMFLESTINLLFGILLVSFVAVVVTGVVLVLVFVRREANLSELQADFVSKVSHELRTPLTAIRLFAETIERSDDAVTRQKCTSLLVAESERLTLLIERLLDWGRMESGRRLYELKNEQVKDVVDDAIKAYEPRKNLARDLELVVECEGELPGIVCDRAAMADTLVNLISNAHKYGGTPPVVTLSAKKNAKGEIVIAVRDNGEGIPRPEHRRIFEKFYRIDDRLSRSKEGSGLGLAIVNHVARAHRARVVVDSAPGQGSTFSIVLPTA